MSDDVLDGETEDGGEELAVGAQTESGAAAALSGACLSCGAPIVGPFCAACGQKNDDLRRSSLVLAREFMRDTFGFDSRMWRTLGLMAIAPGLVPSNYSGGKRSRYTPPVRMFLVVSFLFFLTLALSKTLLVAVDLKFDGEPLRGVVIGADDNVEARETVNEAIERARREAGAEIGAALAEEGEGSGLKVSADSENCPTSASLRFFVRQSELAPIDRDLRSCVVFETEEGASDEDRELRDSLERLVNGLARAAESPAAFNNDVNNWLPRIMFLMTPILALLLALFIRGRDALLFDHLVLSLYSHAVGFAVVIAAVLLSQAGVPNMGFAAVLAIGLYFIVALKRSYGRGWIKTLWTASMTAFLYVILLFSGVMWVVTQIIWQG